MADWTTYNNRFPMVREHWIFPWDCSLSPQRMQDISEWVGSLSEEHRSMLEDLTDEVFRDARHPTF